MSTMSDEMASSSTLSSSLSSSSSSSSKTEMLLRTPEQVGGEEVGVGGEGDEEDEEDDDFKDFVWSPPAEMGMFKPMLTTKKVIQSHTTTSSSLSSTPPPPAPSSITNSKKTQRPLLKRRDTPIPSRSSLPSSSGERFPYPSEGFETTLTTSPTSTPTTPASTPIEVISSSSILGEQSRSMFVSSLKVETIEKWRNQSRPEVFWEEDEREMRGSWISVLTNEVWVGV